MASTTASTDAAVLSGEYSSCVALGHTMALSITLLVPQLLANPSYSTRAPVAHIPRIQHACMACSIHEV